MSGYFDHVRREIAPLLPPSASLVLDIGCGAGQTAAWIKSLYPQSVVLGLEGNAALHNRLSRNVDQAHIVDLDHEVPDVGNPDLVLMLDVLEHLKSPERLLAHVAEILAPGGCVIVSLPNVAHLSVSLPLLLHGRFDYADAGILDRTHLKFFVKRSVVSLLNGEGLQIKRGLNAGIGPKAKIVDRLTLGALRERLTRRYIVSARAMNGAGQPPIGWSLA